MERRSWLTGCAAMVCSGTTLIGSGRALAVATPGAAAGYASSTPLLPLFPLDIVAFPGELVLLHVFEPRYKQLVAESAESGASFGIVTIVPGGASSVGTEMGLERILAKGQAGEMDIAVRGLRVFHLESFQRVVEGKLCSAGQVSFLHNEARTDPELQSALVRLYNRKRPQAGPRRKIVKPFPENLSFFIGHDVGFSRAEELQLLTMSAEQDRQRYILQHLLRTQ